ncbi:MAG TPA: AAA family ATPase [Pseudonocardiaceae bacterium]|nr:AAA family ATPase [Pseudonocardiaceae bacterium]
MTGRYEEQPPGFGASWQAPGAPQPEFYQQPPDSSGQHQVPGTGGAHQAPEPPNSGAFAAQQHAEPDYGTEPPEDTTYPAIQPVPDPSSGSFPAQSAQPAQPPQPPHVEAGTQYVEPVGSGSFPAQAQSAGAHHGATASQSGPYPVQQQVQQPGSQSGPYAVQPGSQSGPYAVQPGSQGTPYPQQGSQGAAYPQQQGNHAFPFEQQYPAGGPAQPPAPMPAGPVPPGAPPGNLSRQTQAAVHELSSSHLLKQAKRPPQTGWRRAVYKASGHLVNMGESPADLRKRELIARINQPLRGCYKIAMLSLKGGVGKTTTTTTLGSTFSSLRGDRVIAVDANPDRGTLSQKIPLETTATVRHLLRDAGRITRYSDVRAYTSQGPSRLEVLASEQDPAVSEAFSEDDYRRTIDLLEHFYNIVLTDCGTGLMHSAMKGVLDIADSLVIVSSGSVDGARSASATLDWLDAHGYHDLVARSVAVINSVRPRSGAVNLDKLAEHFGARCRAVCRIPFDPHLEEGAEIELDRLNADTRLALLELGSTVADDFPNDNSRR